MYASMCVHKHMCVLKFVLHMNTPSEESKSQRLEMKD